MVDLEITNVVSDEEKIAKSINDAARITGMDCKSITRRLVDGIVLKGFKFRALGQ